MIFKDLFIKKSANYSSLMPLRIFVAIYKGILVGHGGRPAGNIRSGYPLPWLCKDDRGIEIPAKRFTAMTDLATMRITFSQKSR